jgi:hypothetical protein
VCTGQEDGVAVYRRLEIYPAVFDNLAWLSGAVFRHGSVSGGASGGQSHPRSREARTPVPSTPEARCSWTFVESQRPGGRLASRGAIHGGWGLGGETPPSPWSYIASPGHPESRARSVTPHRDGPRLRKSGYVPPR